MGGILLGIFVGGRGTRMGGRDKSQLPAPDGQQTLLQRWLRVASDAGIDDVVLVGASAGDDTLSRVRDRPPGIGPLGGLAGVLAHAGERSVLTVACDMPYVEPALLRRLATEHPDASALAPRDAASQKWQAMFARYDASAAATHVAQLIAEDRRSLQHLFALLDARQLPLSAAEQVQLRDWDTPEDMSR